jgi:hypothetical protein
MRSLLFLQAAVAFRLSREWGHVEDPEYAVGHDPVGEGGHPQPGEVNLQPGFAQGFGLLPAFLGQAGEFRLGGGAIRFDTRPTRDRQQNEPCYGVTTSEAKGLGPANYDRFIPLAGTDFDLDSLGCVVFGRITRPPPA